MPDEPSTERVRETLAGTHELFYCWALGVRTLEEAQSVQANAHRMAELALTIVQMEGKMPSFRKQDEYIALSEEFEHRRGVLKYQVEELDRLATASKTCNLPPVGYAWKDVRRLVDLAPQRPLPTDAVRAAATDLLLTLHSDAVGAVAGGPG